MKKVLLILMVLMPMLALAQSKQSDGYYNKGVELYNKGKYKEAIPYFEKSDSLGKIEFDKSSSNYHRSKLGIAYCYNLLSIQYCNSYNYTDAIRFGTQALEIQKNTLGEEHPDYATSLDNLGSYYALIGNYTESIKFCTLALEIRRKILGEDHSLYALSLSKLANYNYYIGNYTEAIRLGIQALEIRRKTLGEEHSDYVSSLSNLAGFNSCIGNYTEAIRLGTQALEIRSKTLGEEHPDYASSLSNLALYNSKIDNYTEAIRLGTQALEIRRKTLGEEHPDYASSLSNLASYNSSIGNYTEAVRLCTQALKIRRKVFGEEHPDCAESLNNLASYNSSIGNYVEAIRLCSQAMEIRRKVFGEEHPDYASSLNNLACYNSEIDNYTEAIRLGTQALEIRRKVFGEEHPYYAESLNNLASYNSSIGNYAEAIRLCSQALAIDRKVFGEEHSVYATSLNNLASYNYLIGNYSEAIRLCTQALEIVKEVHGEEHPYYAASLNNLAIYNYEIGNYTEAIRFGTQALEIRRKVFGEEHSAYAQSLNNLAAYNYSIGNYTETIRLGTQALEIRKKALGEEHSDYVQSLNNLAYCNFEYGNYKESTELYRQCFERKKIFILKNFVSMTEKERANVWSTDSKFFTEDIPYRAFKYSNSTFATLAYNGQLLSKGLLLNAELEIQKLIEKSSNKEFEQRYYKIRNDRAMLDKLYEVAPDKRFMNADSLSKVIEREEKLFVESSKELGDYTRNLAIDWKAVQNKLTDKDIAIEFANFYDEKQHIYIALILKKGMSAPEIVTLDSTATNYNAVWKPLDKYLSGVENVYFSPCGKFHTIGIEYLPDDSGEIFAKKYNAYRLTSTRELALEKKANPNKKAAVFGGILYDFGEKTWKEIKDNKDRFKAEFRDVPLVSSGGKASYLKGSEEEFNAVSKILRDGNYIVAEGTKGLATEELFKSLSGTGISNLLISTHGFYKPDENRTRENFNYLMLDQQTKEDNSLSCSGLLLAGANTALDPEKRGQIPEGVEDGILTAKEISRLDFKGLDLVVLSACQTALGEVTSEGVFGLQRGFKKAGAQTIVMSLWKVDDNATKDLMTEFYKNIVCGMSKREAFVKAQDFLRTKYPDPQKWAAFIMVDGIN